MPFVYLYLYVILDIFSRYVVGWMIALRATAQLAKRLISETITREQVVCDELTLHADRGSQMIALPVVSLCVKLGIHRSHNRPHVSNDNPYSESQFGMAKQHPPLPGRFGGMVDSPGSDSYEAGPRSRVHRWRCGSTHRSRREPRRSCVSAGSCQQNARCLLSNSHVAVCQNRGHVSRIQVSSSTTRARCIAALLATIAGLVARQEPGRYHDLPTWTDSVLVGSGRSLVVLL